MIRRVRGLVVALLVSPAVACGGGSDGSGSDGGAGAQDGGPDSGVPSTVDPSNQFAAESDEWSVPENGLTEGFVGPSSSTSYRYWTTIDIDGDRRLDIVEIGCSYFLDRVL